MEKGNSVDPDLIVPVDQVAGEVATRPSEDKENGDGARMLSSEAETIAAFRARQQRAQAFLGSLALSTDAAHTNTQPKRKEKTDRDAFATATNVRVSAVSRTQVESRPVSAGSKNKTQPVSNSSFSLNALKAAVTNSAASDLENQYQPPSAWKNMSDAMGASVNKLLNSASIPDVSNSFLPFFTRPSSIFQPAAPNSNNAPPRKSSLDPAEDIELEIVVLGNHEEPNPNSNRREEVRGTKRPKKELLGKEDYQMKRLTAPPIFGDTSSSVGPSTPRIETLDDEAVTPVERNLSESDDVIPIRVNRAGSLGGSSAPFGLFNMSGGSTSKSHQAMVKVSDRKSSLGGGSPWRMFDPADPNNKFMVGRAPTGSGANSVMEKRITVGRLRTMSSRELDEQTGSPVRRKTGGSRNSLAHHYTYSHNPAYPPSSATAQQQIVHSIQHMTSSVGELITSVFRNPTSGALQHVSYASPHHMSPFEAEMRNLPNLRESTTSTRNMTNNSANNSNSNVSFRGPERKGSMGDATSVVLHVAPGRRSDGSGGSRGEDLDAERQSLIQTIPARHLNNIRTKNSVDLNNLNQLLNAKIIFVPPSGGYPISTFTVIGTVENQPKEKKRKAKSLFGSQPFGDRLGFALEAVKSRKLKLESYQRLLEPTGTLGSVIPEYDIYDPLSLDDPELKTGKHRTVIKLQSYVSSILLYSRPADIKKELNEVFRETHPTVDPLLSLSHIRALKIRMMDVGRLKGMELSSVAIAMVYFEKLVFKNFATRANRRLIASVCLLLAAKVNDIKEFKYNELLEVIERVMEVSPKEVFQQEFAVYAALEFNLYIPIWQVMPHLERIIEASPRYKSLDDYLQGATFFQGFS